MAGQKRRADHIGKDRVVYDRNRRKILQTQDTCAICGRPIDKSLKYPNLYAATVDHIVPLNKGGHPSDINNLQIAHFICNRLKSDKIIGRQPAAQSGIYLTADWKSF